MSCPSDTTVIDSGSDRSVLVEPLVGLTPEPLAGRFDLLEELGRGGMGVVYRARDRSNGDLVAVKLCRRADERGRERFRREAGITRALRHPGIVRLVFRALDAPVPFLVYELIPDASTLDELLPHLPLRRRVELVRDVGRAVGCAHQAGVVHRDVKASNILVDRAGRARLTDFGLATARGLPKISRRSRAIGTPLAMAPEQVEGRDATPATDVWALGVVLYQALTGELPFVGETFDELAEHIVAATPVWPRERFPDVPRDLEAICLKALQPRPSRRYADADALADDLDVHLAAGPLRRLALEVRLRLVGAVFKR